MSTVIKKLGEILLENKLLTDEQLMDTLEKLKDSELKLGQFLVQQGNISEEKIVSLLCEQLNVERYEPGKFPVDRSNMIELIPFDDARKYKVVPLKKEGRLSTIAMLDPTDLNALDHIETIINSEVEAVLCTENELKQLVSMIYDVQSDLGDVLKEAEAESSWKSEEIKEEEAGDVHVKSLEEMAGEPTVVRMVNTIFDLAIHEGASDIHVSPQKKSVQLRFRIDGKLHEMKPPAKAMFPSIVARVKVLANMDITVARKPQDGRFSLKKEKKEINVRVSTIPTIYGENVVLRLLDMSTGIYSLNNLGMSDNDIEKMREIIHKPYGMILSTGPAGNGKSTSLYAILKEIYRPEINIVTLEDPVEYRIETVRQVQLNEKAGMTFANGLRSILRQDPDVVMVGEIRDAETARIAIQAAQTGQRVLSTVHTNDAIGAVDRLIDMGIESFLVSSVLLVSFAQRLVRTVCNYCKEPYTPSQSVLDIWGIDNVDGANFQHGKGCNHCMNSGYRGRTGIFEILIKDESIREMIMQNRSGQEINREAIRSGKLVTLKNDAVSKVMKGVTTFEEAASSVMVL